MISVRKHSQPLEVFALFALHEVFAHSHHKMTTLVKIIFFKSLQQMLLSGKTTVYRVFQ